MSVSTWRKCENEAGFPYYIRDGSNVKQWDHPEFEDILSKMNMTLNIKYSTYRMAYKVISLQDSLKVPGLRIISGVFAHHCLSISESSFVLEPCELESILTDIFFAANKEGTYKGDVDLATEFVLNLLLNVYDCNRTSSVSVQSAKTALVVLSDESNRDKWKFLFGMMADHNGCISPRRLGALLTQIALLAGYLGEKNHFGTQQVQAEVDKCFAKTPGMLGLSEHGLFQWLEGISSPSLLVWMDVRERIRASNASTDNHGDGSSINWKCSLCGMKNPKGLKFKCTRCWGMMVCEKCYLYTDVKPIISNVIHRHKKTHIVKEIIDSQGMPSKCIIGFVRSVKKVWNCPSDCRRGNEATLNVQYPLQPNGGLNDRNGDSKDVCKVPMQNGDSKSHKVFTSTVGKSAGQTFDPRMLLQDIIAQLENQNKALKSLSGVLNESQQVNSLDRRIQLKVENHFGQITTQINRLKVFKENLLPNYQKSLSPGQSRSLDKTPPQQNMRMQAFEVFSPIPMIGKDLPANETVVLEHKNLKTSFSSGNMMRPGVLHMNSDSISTVSMSDISTWFGNATYACGTNGPSQLNVEEEDLLECYLLKQVEEDGKVVSTVSIRLETDAEKTVARDGSVRPVKHDKNSFVIPPGTVASEDKFNADLESVATSNNKMKELNADLDSVLDRLQTILANNFTLDETSFDNTQLQETANEMEGLLGTLIRGVEQRRTVKGDKI